MLGGLPLVAQPGGSRARIWVEMDCLEGRQESESQSVGVARALVGA